MKDFRRNRVGRKKHTCHSQNFLLLQVSETIMQKQNHSVFPKLWNNKGKQFLKVKTKGSGLCSELAKSFVHLMYLFSENEYEENCRIT
jgi:hypothetical protein